MSRLLRTLANLIFKRTHREDTPTKPNLPPVSDTASDHNVNYTPTYRWYYFFINLLLLVISAGSITAIALLLFQQQDRELSTWQHDISIHSTIGWLATLGKMCLLIPLAESIGQAKWALFNKGRRKLSDLDLADSASRHAFGALGWILRFRGGFFVHFGAALVIVGVGFEPAMQQLVRYEIASVVDPAGNASLAVNRDYAPVRGLAQGLIYATPQAVLWGANSAILGQAISPAFSCPSGNCTFPAAATLGICSTCGDITASLARSCRDLSEKDPYCLVEGTCFTTGQLCTYSHPGTNITVGGGDTFFRVVADGAKFEPSSAGMVSLSRDVVNLTAVFIQPGEEEDLPDVGSRPNIRLPIAPGHVSAKNGTHRARAFSCALSYCEQRLHSNVIQGVLHEKRSVADDSYEVFTMAATKFQDVDDEFLEKRLNLTRSQSSTQVSVTALYAFSRGFANSLTGNSSKPPDDALVKPGRYSELHRAWYEKLVEARFDEVMDVMAESMSGAIRNDGGGGQAAGSAWVSRLFLRARWVWVALPGTVWTGTMALLLAVTVKAKKKHSPWLGSSQLAGTFIDLEKAVRSDVDELDAGWNDKGGMREVGEKFRLRVAPVHSLTEGRAKMELTRISSPV